MPSRVPPNSSLLFEVEVLRVSTPSKLLIKKSIKDDGSTFYCALCLRIKKLYTKSFLLQMKSNRETADSPVTIQEPVTSQSSDQLPDILSEPSGTRKRSTDSVSQLR